MQTSNTTYFLSGSSMDNYFLSPDFRVMHPANHKFYQGIRQILSIAFDTFEKEKLLLPALPANFSIDALPIGLEIELERFLITCFEDVKKVTLDNSKNGKLKIFLE